MRLILASGSPQRRAILAQLGLDFEVVVSGAEELTAGPAEEVALENAYRKAAGAGAGLRAGTGEQALIVAADTVVALGRELYGKPEDEDQAARTLRALSGRSHRVITGLCTVRGEAVRTAASVTEVRFRALDERLLAWYLATGEWRERAGGYAIQGYGAALVTELTGDYSNVVGLPVPRLLELVPDLLYC